MFTLSITVSLQSSSMATPALGVHLSPLPPPFGYPSTAWKSRGTRASEHRGIAQTSTVAEKARHRSPQTVKSHAAPGLTVMKDTTNAFDYSGARV